MLVKVRRIGNSQGIILSKNMMEQCNIKDTVNVEVKNYAIVIMPANTHPRDGWEEQFKSENARSDENLMGDFSNAFDDTEWTW